MNTAVQDFLIKVAEDPALQEELAKAMESENDREAVTELAKSKGYEFTSEELAQAIDALQAQAPDAELSEEELESVAGGATPAATPFIVKSVKVSVKVTVVASPSIPKPRW